MSFLRSMYAAGSNVRHTLRTNKIVGANDGERLGFARKLRVVLRHRPGVAQLHSATRRGINRRQQRKRSRSRFSVLSVGSCGGVESPVSTVWFGVGIRRGGVVRPEHSWVRNAECGVWSCELSNRGLPKALKQTGARRFVQKQIGRHRRRDPVAGRCVRPDRKGQKYDDDSSSSNRVFILSQQKDMLFEKPAVISWKTKEQ